LSRVPPRFTPSKKITTERIEGLNFGPEGWLSKEEFHLLAEVVRMPKRRSDLEDGSVVARESEDNALAADLETESGSEQEDETSEQQEPDPPQPQRSKRLKGTTGDSGQGLGRRGGVSGGR
jgi:hypothetical protein